MNEQDEDKDNDSFVNHFNVERCSDIRHYGIFFFWPFFICALLTADE